jgi:hypothetical protein
MKTPINNSQGMAYGWWHFPQQLLHDLTFEVEFISGDERSPGRYYQLYQGQIGGCGMYFGFQTDIMRHGLGWQGKGLLFSRWGTRKSEDAAPVIGGWVENAGYEGDFVGVRSLFDWKIGRYCCWLSPCREEVAATWYEFRVRQLSDGQEATAGSLRFPHVKGQRPLIHSGGVSWTEVYHGASFAEDVPTTQFDVRRVRANRNRLSPIRCNTSYNQSYPCADAEVSIEGVLSLRSGRGVSQIHPAGQYNICA